MVNAFNVIKNLKVLGTPAKAKASSWFFKTGKGQYGCGDIFFGVTVPEQRRVAKKYKNLPLTEISKLLQSEIHECRQTALLILVGQYKKADEKKRDIIAKFYLSHSKRVNNWDLVDLSAHSILGQYLLKRDRKILYKFARSKNLWQRRIAIISTFPLIREGGYDDTLKIAEILLKDSHDLIHKAVGWALREVGNRSPHMEEVFLKKYAPIMPRVTLRYAIEKFPEKKRKKYLSIQPNGF